MVDYGDGASNPNPIPPGELLEEELDARGIEADDFAARLGLPTDHFLRVLAGDAELTDEIAAGLERELEIPTILWVRLEARCRSELAREAALAEAGSSA